MSLPLAELERAEVIASLIAAVLTTMTVSGGWFVKAWRSNVHKTPAVRSTLKVFGFVALVSAATLLIQGFVSSLQGSKHPVVGIVAGAAAHDAGGDAQLPNPAEPIVNGRAVVGSHELPPPWNEMNDYSVSLDSDTGRALVDRAKDYLRKLEMGSVSLRHQQSGREEMVLVVPD